MKSGLQHFFEGHGLGGDDVHQRAALLAGEDALVDGCGELLLAENKSGARAAQRFVRGGGDDLRVRHGRGMHAAGDEAGEVRHVDDEQRAHLVGDLAHAGKVEDARIGAAAADDDLRLFSHGNRLEFVVVDDFGVLADRVGDDLVELAGEVELVAVGEMAAVGEIEAEDGVAGLQDGHVGGGVGLRAGVRLHVGVLGAEDLLGAVAGEVLDHVGELASAVVAAAGIALGVLVGEDRAGSLKHGVADEVLGGDHLEAFVLAEDFVFDGGGDLGIGLRERKRHAVGHV